MPRGKAKKPPELKPDEPADERVFGEDGNEILSEAKPVAPAAPEPEPEPVRFAETPEPEPEHADPEPRKETRGRKKGGKNSKKAGREAETPENITKLLLSVHEMLAALTGIPELLLSQEEADKLGGAVHDVEELYGELPYISPEVRAWTNLALTSVMIYWPRYVVIRKREREEAAKDIDVTPIRPNGPEANMSRAGTGTIQH